MRYQVVWDEERGSNLPSVVDISSQLMVDNVSEYLTKFYSCEPVAIELISEEVDEEEEDIQDVVTEEMNPVQSSIEYDFYSETFWNSLNKSL